MIIAGTVHKVQVRSMSVSVGLHEAYPDHDSLGGPALEF